MDFSEVDQLPAVLQKVVTCQQLCNGQVLFHRNEASYALYAVKTGQLRLLHYTKSGQTISHYTVRAGEICAEVVLHLETYACSAIAEEPTEVLVFPKSSFLSALQQDPDFATAFIKHLSYRLHMTKILVELRSIRSAPERVLHYLQMIIPPEQNTLLLEQPLKNIATDLGITPEVLSRTLSQLESEGVIARDRRKITLFELG